MTSGSMPVEQPAFNTIQYNMVITPSNTKALIYRTDETMHKLKVKRKAKCT